MVKVGKYKLVRRLASGGMGEVWEGALEGSLGFARRVAIKRMMGVEDVPGWENMFLDEARIASQLHHANIVPVLDFGVDDGKPFQVLELIDGVDAWKMAQMAAAKKIPLPFEVALHLCTEVAHALHYAHNARGENGRSLRIVHRDVTPDNVLVSWEGDVKLSDFGIAKARDRSHKTQAGVRVGKPSYMAPEQATGGDVDERTDVFMLGCVLQALLTGRSPLAGENKLADLLAGQELPIDPRVPDDIKEIVARAVRRSKAERYPDAEQMAAALGTALHARLKTDPRSVLREFLQQLRPPVKRTGMLDALLFPETAEQGAHAPATVTERDEARAAPVPKAKWKGRAALGAGLGLVAAIATAMGLGQPRAPAPVTNEGLHAPQPTPVPTPPPIPVEPPVLVEVKAAPVKATTRVAKVKPPPEGVKPAGRGVLLIGGPGAQRCEIRVDGKSYGFAPKRLELEAGPHDVELLTPAGGKVGPKSVDLTDRHTESDPYRWIVD